MSKKLTTKNMIRIVLIYLCIKQTFACSELIKLNLNCEPEIKYKRTEGVYKLISRTPIIYKHQERKVYVTLYKNEHWAISYSKEVPYLSIMKNSQCNEVCPYLCKTKWAYYNEYRRQMIRQPAKSIEVIKWSTSNKNNLKPSHIQMMIIIIIIKILQQ